MRQAKVAFAAGDFAAAMRTGVVCRRHKTVGGAKDPRVVEEYEINTALIESLNSVEKRAAIETGQEQENIQVTGQISARAMTLQKVCTIEELEDLKNRMEAQRAHHCDDRVGCKTEAKQGICDPISRVNFYILSAFTRGNRSQKNRE